MYLILYLSKFISYNIQMVRKLMSKIKYPKLLVFLVTILIATIIFWEGMHSELINNFFLSLGYSGDFLGGLLYSYGFTSTSATAILLIIAKEKVLWISILVAGIGAFISDLVIYLFAKNSLLQEVTMFKEESYVIKFRNFLKNTFGRRYRYIMPVVAYILIMSPLPTEIGITILATRKNVSMKLFMVITYILHTIGIATILIIGKNFF
ncbi:MAG: hypothetical protein PHR61_01885 [Candidatus Absconditabacteria bacterium]|nr:hypothetical protein [Candidatus Absconditabacteria bacterium]